MILRISLSEDTFRFLQFSGIGYDLLSSYLVWTDVFVSDNKGNYLLPFWDASVFGKYCTASAVCHSNSPQFPSLGYSPRVPDYLVIDSIAPQLLRWYIDRSQPSAPKLYLRWSEPILLLNQSLIALHSGSGSGLSFPVLSTFSASSSLSNTQTVISLANYCRGTGGGVTALSATSTCEGVTLFSALQDSSTTLYLTMTSGVAVDMAKSANANEEILTRRAQREGGPGESLLCVCR